MNVLVLNSGSSTLKFRVIDTGDDGRNRVMSGLVDRIGGPAVLRLDQGSGSDAPLTREVRDHETAARWMFDHVDRSMIDAVGQRVVHGGSNFHQPVRIDATVMSEIEQLSELAPLHNPACLAEINAAQAALGLDVPMVAVFDTAFHHTMPERAATYAIPQDLAAK